MYCSACEQLGVKMSKLWKDEENKLIKSGRKWSETDYMPYRYAVLYCECCGKDLGKHDIVCTNLQTNMFCGECVRTYVKEVPYNVSDNIIVTADYGSLVSVKYIDGYYPEIIVVKDCYFSKKGRFIKVKGKRYYLNYMPLPPKKYNDT